MLKVPAFSLLVLIIGACNHSQMSSASSASAMSATHEENRGPAGGLAFAQAHCAGCHAVARLKISPHPEAPTFEEVVNTPGLGSETLEAWLRNSHNFPQVMGFEIEPDQIGDLAAYMMTLRDCGEGTGRLRHPC